MALVNLREMLADASKRKYAVGSFNIINLESLHGILEAAVERRSPVILSIAEVHFKYLDLESLAEVAKRAAALAPIPVTLHLDHGVHFETIIRAIRCGFTSVMFDGSILPYEDNVSTTAEVVRVAHSVGVSVEAELGHVGGAEGGSGSSEADIALYTDPRQARDFVYRTGVDALAVAIGSAHGVYRKKPKLDFERLVAIRDATNIPLVLHGGSGIPEEDFKKAIQLGICKINVYTEMAQTATTEIKEILTKDPAFFSFPDLMMAARAAIKQTVTEKIDIFGSGYVCETPNEFCKICGGCILASQPEKEESGEKRRSNTCTDCGSCTEDKYRNSSSVAKDMSEDEIAKVIAEVTRRVLLSDK